MFYKQFYIFRKKWIQSIGNPLHRIFNILSLLCAIIVVIGTLFWVGFPITPTTHATLYSFYNLTKFIFIINLIIIAMLQWAQAKKKQKYQMCIWFVLFFIAIIPDFFMFLPENNFLYTIISFLRHYYFLMSLLTLYSIFIISHNLIRILGRRTNPSLIIGMSFLIFIIIGTILLKMPHCTFNQGITWIDSLFITTSAVCVTGLTSVEVSTTFTHTGLAVILLLIQVGGLGVMTLTSFFALFFMGNTSIYNQLVVKDLINSNSLGESLRKTMTQVLLFTSVIEITGAIIIFKTIHGTMGMSIKEELFFSVFHSISAFCNAGFSTLPGNLGNPLLLYHHSFFYLIISFLVILGGIGFPILVNTKNGITYHVKNLFYRLQRLPRPPHYLKHLYTLNTKIVLFMTFFLLVSGTVVFAATEWNNALAPFSVSDKIIQSFFNATLPRTAGFMSLDPVHFQTPTILIIVFLMWIGGGSQSTAGGIKVNTFAVSLINLESILRNSKTSKVFKRNISPDSIHRANATIITSLLLTAIATFMLTFTETDLSLTQIVFECVSALGTVGSSLNATLFLSDTGKIIITLLMFVGRIGFITLVMGLIKPRKNVYQYPTENIIIN